MDLIYTDVRRKDVGVLQDYTLDLAFGSDENDFALTLDLNNHCCEPGCLIYVEGTEYGGIIDGLGIVTKDDTLTYVGRTWHGILATKIIEPNEGEAYLKVSGEANAVIGEMLNRLGVTDLIVASKENSGLMVDGYAFDRYIDGYSGIKKMLESVSAKPKFTFVADRVILSAIPIVDYSEDEQFDNDTVEMQFESTNAVNHLICLGKGELENRLVVHLYVDADGNVGTEQFFFGIQEITVVYDYPNAESEEEMVKDAVKKLEEEYAKANQLQLDFTADDDTYDVGDIVAAHEIVTGIVATAKISKKIVTINKGEVTIQYKVGE